MAPDQFPIALSPLYFVTSQGFEWLTPRTKDVYTLMNSKNFNCRRSTEDQNI